MIRLLSTKFITLEFKKSLLNNKYSISEFSFIKIKPLKLEEKKVFSNIIFTSKNAAKIAFNNSKIESNLIGKNFYCVGDKTENIILEKNQKLIKKTKSSSILANFLIKNYKNDSFSYFCGKKRLLELEKKLQSNKIFIDINIIYDTISKSKELNTNFDGVLFFSPSGVKSFFQKNKWLTKAHGFCIGETTANELKKFTTRYSIASKPDEKHMLSTINKYFKKIK
jgi:uroporphyrinogen-III synthase